MNSHWSDFEHRFWKFLKSHQLEKSSYLVAVSGGLDSMVLLQTVLNVRPQAQIRVAHFHHGDSSNEIQNQYRDRVLEFVKHKISNLKLELISERSAFALHSEAEMREERWKFIRKNCRANEIILTGHHLDDWLETALIKLIRGTSLDGIAGFQEWNGEVCRPFLKIPKTELLFWAEANQVSFLEDPSNQSYDYLRNWVREKWLVDLETRQKGSVANLSRSLLRIIEEFTKNSTFELRFLKNDSDCGLDRNWFMGLSKSEQLKAIALYLKNRQIHEFTQGHLEEIIKRLDKNQKNITFEIFERKWVINALQIMLQ